MSTSVSTVLCILALLAAINNEAKSTIDSSTCTSSYAPIERPKSVAAQTLEQTDAPQKAVAPLVEGIGTGTGTGTEAVKGTGSVSGGGGGAGAGAGGTANGDVVVPLIRPTRPRESIACHDEDGVSSDSDENESAHQLDKLPEEPDARRTASA